MHNLLYRLLHKRGVKDVTELDDFEKQDFEKWNKILSGGELTVEKIKQFCESQVKVIEGQWRNLDNVKEKNERLITQHIIYKTLLELIEAPNKERENLETYLESLLK